MQRSFASPSSDYFIAIVASLLALLLRGSLDPILGEHVPFMLSIFAAVLLSSFVGFYPTILAVVLLLLGTRYFFVTPRGTLVTEDPLMQLTLLLFVLCGIGSAWIGATAQRLRFRALLQREELNQQRVIAQNEMVLRREIESDLDRKQRELRESQEIFRKLVEMVPQLVWITDPKGRVNFFNQRWYDFTGLTPEQCLGEGWSVALHPEDHQRTVLRWSESLESSEVYEIEYRLRAADGTYRWFLARGDVYRDTSGQIVYWFGTCTDIDDQRRLTDSLDQMVRERTQQLSETNRVLFEEIEERKLIEQRERLAAVELRRSNMELEMFAYVASHDLQEPLRKIQSFGDRLKSRSREALDESARDYLDRMHKAAGRMRQLIDDLLSFSRVSTKKRNPVQVDLNAILREVLIDLEWTIEQAGASIETNHLPTIEADAFQMRQLFQNLIGNALKFRKSSVPVQLKITGSLVAECEGNRRSRTLCEVKFADNGIGFDEKYLDRIFQLCQRLHGRAEYEGTGIGLAICRRIVERHGGTITARSQPQEGATFIVTLPLTLAVEQERGNVEEPSETRDDPRRGR